MNKCIVCAIVKKFVIEDLPHNVKTKRALGYHIWVFHAYKNKYNNYL